MFDIRHLEFLITTWTNFAAGTGAATTTWNYDIYRGFLSNKVYAGSVAGPSDTYTAAGRLKTRTWARATSTTYTPNAAGDIATITYGDSTPGVANITTGWDGCTGFCNGITTTLAYDSANDPLGESYSGGVLDGLSVTNVYDSLLRRMNISVMNSPPSVLASTATLRRRRAAAHRLRRNQYRRVLLSCQFAVGGPYCLSRNGASVMTKQNIYDYVNRLTRKSSAGAVPRVPFQLRVPIQCGQPTHAGHAVG